MKILFVVLIAQCGLLYANDPKASEVWTPVPPDVTAPLGKAPSDAVILFDGKDLSQWENDKGGDALWESRDGILTAKPGAGDLFTRRAFSDCQLHIEWKTPEKIRKKGQQRGNSGIFFQKLYELQILDSFKNPTYANGQAGSIYKQHAPLVNASKGPGEWQSYDVVYQAPRFDADGTLSKPAYMTVFHNGVLIQHHVEIKGPTSYLGAQPYTAHAFKQALRLQDHGDEVSFRNIWVRELSNNNSEILFNNDDLKGWYTFQDGKKNVDTKENFRIKDGLLHILGDGNGYIATEKIYRNYHFKIDFRWGDKKWAPRVDYPRDSGILFHFPENAKDEIWPYSIECQIEEGNCGDIWFLKTKGLTEMPGKRRGAYTQVIKSENLERPKGEWNTMEVVTIGDGFEFYVNGRLVNSAKKTDVQQGRIVLQSECAEVYYRNATLTPLK